MEYTVKNYRAVFPDTANRDAYVEQYFPKRRLLVTPGAYAVPGGYLYVNGVEVAYEIADHKQDSDCQPYIDTETDTCFVCGVYHGSPCPWCDGCGFHESGCQLLVDHYVDSAKIQRI